jgi:hypothetical protein
MGKYRIAIAAAVAAVLAAPAPALARADDPEIVSIAFTTPTIDVSTGWAVTTVSLHLRHPAGLSDRMQPASSDNHSMVGASGGDARSSIGVLDWTRLDRVSGTATDGVWRGAVEVSPGWHGDYTVDRVQLIDLDNQAYYLVVDDGPTVTVTGGEAWRVTNVPEPIRVVTGDERWRPQAQVTNMVTGRPVGGARLRWTSIFGTVTMGARESAVPGPAADAAGRWRSPVTYGIDDLMEHRLYAYGGRGSRGYSLQGIGCAPVTIRLQASATYSDTTLTGDQSLVVTGNVWPAPSIAGLGAQVLLQQAGAAGWQTVATAQPRANGRYTITWLPVRPGTYQVRIRVPGNGSPLCAPGSTGTTLATTTVSATWSNR